MKNLTRTGITNHFKGLGTIAAILLTAFFITNCSNPGEISPEKFQKIQTGFVTPADSNNVWCYWYWINDDISKEGITKDLEAMKEVGIGTAFIGNINPPEVNGRVPLFSDYWWECMVHAVNEGKRVGVNIGTFNCPGWSQSGGPWVKPEMAMRHLVYSETRVKGPGKIQVKLTQPARPFQDVYVLAFPAVEKGKVRLSNTNSKITGSPKIRNISNLLDGDTTSVAFFNRGAGDYTIDIKSDKTITARSIQLFPGKQRIKCNCELYALVDGKYELEKTFEFDRSNTNVNVGPDVYGPVSIALNNISSNAFRLVCKSSGGWNNNAGFSEIAISEAPVLERYVEKKMGKMFPTPQPEWNSYMWENQENIDDDALKVEENKVLDISGKMDADGNLVWEAPEGEWTVMRFGMTPTGTKNSPAAPQGKGYEIDKASEKIARFHFENYMGELIKRIPKENRSALKIYHCRQL